MNLFFLTSKLKMFNFLWAKSISFDFEVTWHFFVVILSSPMCMCVCRSLVVSRRRRLKASSLSLMWQEYWQGHSDEEEIFIRNALAMGRLLTWDWLQHNHYPPEIQPIKVKSSHLIFHYSFGYKLWKCSVCFDRNCFERCTGWIPPPSPLRWSWSWTLGKGCFGHTGKVSAKWQESNFRFNFSN